LPGFAGLPIETNEALLDPLLNFASGKIGQQLADSLIEPIPGIFAPKPELLLN
jgi:hypothetical protein